MTTGVVAGLVKLLTGAKLVIEIATCPELIYLTESPQPSLKNRLLHLYSDSCLQLSMRLADRAHFLFPGQLSAYPSLRGIRNSVFHEFVPLSSVGRRNLNGDAGSRFVLLVGAPWYLKGADLLIRAFQRIAPEFPGLSLKLLGHFPDRSQMEILIGDSVNIEILKATPHPATLDLISHATILVLPSRCEGMGRVLIEAMAAGVPVLGSDVGGIPFVIRDGECGLTFPKGDAHALEDKLRELLTDAALRHRMGEEGYRQAHARFSEAVYVEEFTRMVNAAIQGAA